VNRGALLSLSATLLLFLPLVWIGPPRTIDTRVWVDPSRTLAAVPATGIGANAAVWDGHLTDPSLPGLLRQAGVSLLRYPGGETSDLYDWKTNTVLPGYGWEGPENDFSEFMKVVGRAHAQALITVNYGSGSPQQAAAWVRQANRVDHDDVRYWEIGNEVYGDGAYGTSWEFDDHAQTGPVAYAENLIKFAQAMRAVDPSIEIGADLIAPGTWPDGIVLPGQKLDWDRTVLSLAGSVIDFVSIHWYPESADQISDAGLLAMPDQIGGAMSTLRQEIAEYAPDRNIGVMVTETDSVPTSPGPQTLSLVNGLFLAEDYAGWLAAGAESVDWWDVHNGVTPEVSAGDAPSYGTYGLLSDGTCRKRLCEPAAESPFPTYRALLMVDRWARPEDAIVAAGSDGPSLSVFADQSPSGRESLMLVDRSPSTVYNVTPPAGWHGHQLDVASYGAEGSKTEEQSRGPIPVSPYSIVVVQEGR
jgi:hypothetical protein